MIQETYLDGEGCPILAGRAFHILDDRHPQRFRFGEKADGVHELRNASLLFLCCVQLKAEFKAEFKRSQHEVRIEFKEVSRSFAGIPWLGTA